MSCSEVKVEVIPEHNDLKKNNSIPPSRIITNTNNGKTEKSPTLILGSKSTNSSPLKTNSMISKRSNFSYIANSERTYNNNVVRADSLRIGIEDSLSSNKKKVIVKVHNGTSKCLMPDINKPEEDKQIVPEKGKLYVFVIRVNCNQKLYNPYVNVHLGDQTYNTCVSGLNEGLWNEGFMFDVSIHTQLFGVLRFDLYNGNLCLPDRFIGRCEIRIEALRRMPEMFDSWYELLDKSSLSPGAINIKIQYSHQNYFQNSISESFESLLLNECEITDKTTSNRSLTRLPTINEKEIAKFEEDLSKSFRNSSTNSWYESIGKIFLSDEMFNVLKMIKRTMFSLGQEFNLSPIQLFEGVTILDRYYSLNDKSFEQIKAGEDIIRNLSLVEKTRDLFRYSLAAYGWIGMNFIGKGKGVLADSIKKDSSLSTIVKFLCISKEDILISNFQPTKIFDQVFFIAYDRRYDSIVFSIRGTLNVKDTLADLVCEYVKWNGGLIHGGILSSAIFFYKNFYQKLKDIVKEKNPKCLYLVGHSLGAGIAAALTIMLKNVENEFKTSNDFKIECYCFAPPGMINCEMAKKYQDCIFSFVNNNDIVPRLSYGSLLDLREMIYAVLEDDDKDNNIVKLQKMMESNEAANLMVQHKLKLFEKCRNDLRDDEIHTTNLKLCIPGKIYNILSNPKKIDDVILKECNTEDMDEIKIKKSMFIDHSFKNYLESLNYLFECTLLNKLNVNMKITASPKLMSEDTEIESISEKENNYITITADNQNQNEKAFEEILPRISKKSLPSLSTSNINISTIAENLEDINTKN